MAHNPQQPLTWGPGVYWFLDEHLVDGSTENNATDNNHQSDFVAMNSFHRTKSEHSNSNYSDVNN